MARSCKGTCRDIAKFVGTRRIATPNDSARRIARSGPFYARPHTPQKLHGLCRLHVWDLADSFNVDLSLYIDDGYILNSNNLSKIQGRYNDLNFVINFKCL